uniref:Putative cnidarian restricted protein n=1 Tax=Clytia hemisphaerica TaxID=252671 RepID=A0A069DN88_9CNID
MTMTWKRVHYILVCAILTYVLLLFVLTNRTISNKLRQTKNDDTYIFDFNVRLSRDGIEETSIDNKETNTRLKFLAQRKPRKDLVKSEEIIFIDKKEFEDGSIELDQTNIKQRQKEVMFEQKRIKLPESASSRNDNEKKYLFAFRYFEQLSMATKNLLSLASLATSTGRTFVEPFVNSSRFCGLPSGTSFSRLMEEKVKFTELKNYFDQEKLKDQLQKHGYNEMVPYQEFREQCTKIDVVVHFLYNDSNILKNLQKWYKINNETVQKALEKVKRTGYSDCPFVERSRIGKFLGKPVQRYVCVDPEQIRSSKQLEKDILQNSKCAAIIFWKGSGPKRTHFPLAPKITEPLQPADIQHAKRLVDIAYDYIRNTIKRPFIAVHIRIERHVRWKGIHAARTCIRHLSDAILKHKKQNNLKKVFMAHDLGPNGSDTLKRFVDKKTLAQLENKIETSLQDSYRFDPIKYGLYDRGSIAIVEMHIMTLGESLFTLGRGNFHDWVTELYLKSNANDESLLHKICQDVVSGGSKK